MTEQTYLFYDIESTGINKCFDQVLQFAAIRTDLNLNEVERHNFLVKLTEDVTPSVMASITHHISLKTCASGISELEAIEKIHQIINTPGTISLGYNTLGFDDEFLRFSFYRHLLPPYTHQYANDCARMDLYPMTVLYYLYKPEVLHWPRIDDKPTMKLEKISEANKLALGRAHDAMVDVEATLALAKKFKQEPSMWVYLLGYFDKREEKRRLAKLPITLTSSYGEHKEGIMVLGRFGSRCQYCAPVIDLGEHRHYKNQHIWLRLDLPELIELKTDLDSIKKNTWVLHKKFAEPGFILPNIDRYNTHLSNERKEIMHRNKAFLLENPALLAGIVDYHLEDKYPEVPGTDAQAALYQSNFWTTDETTMCEKFHQGGVSDKLAMLDKFSNPDLKEMAIRIVGRNFNGALQGDALCQYEDYLARCKTRIGDELPMDFRGNKRYGLEDLITDIANCRQEKNLSKEQVDLVDELEQAILIPLERTTL